MVSSLSAIRRLMLDLLFPSKCVSCGASGELICGTCFAQIHRVDELIPAKYLSGVFSIYRYEKGGVLQKAVKAIKYRFIREVSVYFRHDIECVLKCNFANDYIAAAVPLHRKREKWRGFNQAAELLYCIDFPRCDFLTRKVHTKPQAELHRADRLSNLRNAFAVCGDVSGKNIILIDDICTTGATLYECARSLKEAGAKEVWGVVLGHG